MKISNDNIYPEEDLEKFFEINNAVCFTSELAFDDLILPSFNQWEEIKNHFRLDFRYFDKLLFKIHFKRNNPLREHERYNILNFLLIGYYYSKDVRYFNEFLFFYEENEKYVELLTISKSIFYKNIVNHKHVHPLTSTENVSSFLAQIKKKENLHRIEKPVNIGLIGNPIFFKKIKTQLNKIGHNVSVYLVKYHQNKYLNALFNFPLFWQVLRLLRIIPNYKVVNHRDENLSLAEKGLKGQHTVGFHKLGIIIRNNIIKNFSKGLLNDHWAVLPFVRGRSTIAFSLLFGFEVGATVHLVTNKIDEGAIVNVYTYNIDKIHSIKGITKKVRNDLTARIVDAMTIYISSNYRTIENNPNMGLTYYSIHPVLANYIETDILNKNA